MNSHVPVVVCRHFRYLCDPLFLLAAAAWFVNRILEETGYSPQVLQCYLNDAVCIPLWVPVILVITRRSGWRQHDDPPEILEIVVPLLTIAAIFELLLPVAPGFAGRAISDPTDIHCYVAGSLAGRWFWSFWYRVRREPECCPALSSESVRLAGGVLPGEPRGTPLDGPALEEPHS